MDFQPDGREDIIWDGRMDIMILDAREQQQNDQTGVRVCWTSIIGQPVDRKIDISSVSHKIALFIQFNLQTARIEEIKARGEVQHTVHIEILNM